MTNQTIARRWMYLDAPLLAFVTLMVAAASITAHGTYTFYSYILTPALAVAATVVITMGIPLLELAAVLDKTSRLRYLLGMVFLLFLEALAQYYQGQAQFLRLVRVQFPTAAGIDLSTFAGSPRGRLLPMLYLAALSFVVVYFGYAAAARVRELRTRAYRVAQDGAQQAELAAQLRTATQQAVQAQQDAAHVRAELEQARAQLAHVGQGESEQVAQLQVALDEWARKLRTADDQLRTKDDQLRKAGELLRTQGDELRTLKEQAAQPVEISGVDLLRLARALRKYEVPYRDVARIVGMSDSTLRSRLDKLAQTNGHAEAV